MDFELCMKTLENMGNLAMRKIYLNGGALEPLYGVKMGDLRNFAKEIGIDHALALSLYASNNHDAMMLSGMICDPKQLTRETLDHWADTSRCIMIAERSVAPLAAGRTDAWEIADAWIKSTEEMTACAGFTIYGMLFAFIPDQDLNLDKVKKIIDEIEARIKIERPYLQNAMNNCLIMAGMYIVPMTAYCKEVADRIGYVKPTIKVNNCNIQSASDYIIRYAPRKKMKSI
ncbi:MAG: DNA alkylation repair protein [Erysipelotrichaceae bacterium]